ncbi:GDP-mannose transporter GONST3 [Striga hermonthica]|uniref:GDP-mannose transporter GONST3 n=1 Tax=Striga hermonthica TaxID=68872 RepID=A0A9N7NI76_STRHE|nr:GDP-mannose transporter GONST3 [Striga hermonthica]
MLWTINTCYATGAPAGLHRRWPHHRLLPRTHNELDVMCPQLSRMHRFPLRTGGGGGADECAGRRRLREPHIYPRSRITTLLGRKHIYTGNISIDLKGRTSPKAYCFGCSPLNADQMSNDVKNPDKENTSPNLHPDPPGPISSCCDSLIKHASVYGIAAGYCISASLLSIINKWAVMKFPYPGALTALQYLTSFMGVIICGWLKVIEHDKLDLLTMWRFLPAAFIFYLSLFTNSELLLHANVDTFIVFRSAVPIFVAIGETLYLHQPWPALKTWLSLATIFAGSVLYVITDYQFTLAAYSWALAYLVSMSIDFVYIKHVVMTIGLNTWGLVLYNNLEALLLFPLELLVMGELKKIERDISDDGVDGPYSFGVVLPVGLSCLFGLAISFFGFSCRRAISATGFTVLGIVNKLLTVVINLVIWDKHSTVVGTVGLLICMGGGVMYQQSTSGKAKTTSEVVKVGESDDEKQKLLELQTLGGQKGDAEAQEKS